MEGVGGEGSGGKLAFHQVALAKRDSGEQSSDESDSSQLRVGNCTLFTLQKTGFGSSALGFWPRAGGDQEVCADAQLGGRAWAQGREGPGCERLG